MRQILLNSKGAVIARMPRPMVESGSVLVRTHYSLISTGTEIASLRPKDDGEGSGPISYSRSALTLLGKAVRDPNKARRKLEIIARDMVQSLAPEKKVEPKRVLSSENLKWERCSASIFDLQRECLNLVTDNSEYGYQAMSQRIPVEPGSIPIIELKGEVIEGSI